MDETVGVGVGPAERGHHAGGDGPTPEPRRRMSARRKQETVLRLLRGEDLELVSRELAVTAAELSGWRDQFLAAGEFSEFVEMHLPNRHAMDTGLGLSEAAKDGGGLLGGAGVTRGAGNALRKHGEGGAVMMIGVPGRRVIMMMVMPPAPLRGVGKAEAAHDNPVSALPRAAVRNLGEGRRRDRP